MLFNGYFSLTFYPYSDNKIGDDGARALAECLKENTTLTQLYLESTSNQVNLWLDAIQSLTFYSYSDNNIGDDGKAALAECRRRNIITW